MNKRFAALTLTGLLLSACGRQVAPVPSSALSSVQPTPAQAARLNAARERLTAHSPLKAQAVDGERVSATKEMTVPVRSDDGSLTGSVTVRLDLIRTATSAYANTTVTYNYPHYAESTPWVAVVNQAGQELTHSSSLSRLSFHGDTSALPIVNVKRSSDVLSPNATSLKEALCAKVGLDLQYNGTFSFHMPINEPPLTPITSVQWQVCEAQPPEVVPTLPPPVPRDPFEYTQLFAELSYNAKHTRSVTSIALEGAPVGSYMDGVYLISIDPACDQTGQVTDDAPLYVGDFWTQAQPPSQTVADRTFTDKARLFVHPATALLATARVFDAQGRFIREVEDMTCLVP